MNTSHIKYKGATLSKIPHHRTSFVVWRSTAFVTPILFLFFVRLIFFLFASFCCCLIESIRVRKAESKKVSSTQQRAQKKKKKCLGIRHLHPRAEKKLKQGGFRATTANRLLFFLKKKTQKEQHFDRKSPFFASLKFVLRAGCREWNSCVSLFFVGIYG